MHPPSICIARMPLYRFNEISLPPQDEIVNTLFLIR